MRAVPNTQSPEPSPSSAESHSEYVVQRWLGTANRIAYLLIGILFLGVALVMGVYAVISFLRHVGGDFRPSVVEAINDLLLVLIILEVIGTVRGYLATNSTSLRPFLYIGIISATRRILAVGAETSLGTDARSQPFSNIMIDLGVNAGVVLALAIALYLFDRQQPAHEAAEEQEAVKRGDA